MNAVIDRLTICTQIYAHTLTQIAQGYGDSAIDNCFIFFSLPSSLSLALSIMLTQTNQCTCVLTPKSQSLTCPRVFTSILEGLTSAETNCLIKLQHQHSVACLYQLYSLLFNNTEPAHYFTHLCEVSSGSTDMSGLWLPRDTDERKKYLNFSIIQRLTSTCGCIINLLA